MIYTSFIAFNGQEPPLPYQRDPSELFSKYLDSVWIDFDNPHETEALRKIARDLEDEA